MRSHSAGPSKAVARAGRRSGLLPSGGLRFRQGLQKLFGVEVGRSPGDLGPQALRQLPAETGPGRRVELPAAFQEAADGNELEYVFDATKERTGVPSLLRAMSNLGIGFKDLNTRQSSLEEIFVSLVHDRKEGA